MTTAGSVAMIYDGAGNRVSRTAGGVTTRFLVDDLTPTGYSQVAEEVASGTVTVRYTHGILRISQSRAGVTHFYGYDGGGSVRQLTDASGAVTDTYTFDAFGVLIDGTGSTANVYRYRGEQWDASVGMYYLRARWYEPGKGRFWTADKWEGCSLDCCGNKYLYGDGNPVEKIDPSGYQSVAGTAIGEGFVTLALRSAVALGISASAVCVLELTASALGYVAIGWMYDFDFVLERQPWSCLFFAKRGDGGTCSCQHRDVFTSGGVSCQLLRERGICTGPYNGTGANKANCQANARENAPAACRGCLGHCKFTSSR
jgi:RHS repeat-associated protein